MPIEYVARGVIESPVGSDPWGAGGAWADAPVVDICNFHAKSSSHRPITRCKLIHHGDALHVAFRVEDRFVRCLNRGYQGMVSRDSCVEFFVEPRPGRGYFNFEWNCGGSMLLYFIEDPTRALDAPFRKFAPVDPEIGKRVVVSASMPPLVDPEITTPTTWTLQSIIPLSLFEDHLGPLGRLAGQRWRGNFFKCGDETSHPHWASWNPIGEALRFHQPEYFAPIRFGDAG